MKTELKLLQVLDAYHVCFLASDAKTRALSVHLAIWDIISVVVSALRTVLSVSIRKMLQISAKSVSHHVILVLEMALLA